MPIQIQNARILTPFSQQDGAVLISGDRIVDVSRSTDAPRGTKVIDAKNLYLVPGYIDVHVHAGGGRSVLEGIPEAITEMCDAHVMDGTTTLLPTTDISSIADTERAIDAVREAQRSASHGTIAGIHLQGPFLSREHVHGPAAEQLLTPAEADWRSLLSRWDGIRMVGLAPELSGALAIGDMLREHGIIASISHSDASYDQVLSAISHGFTDVTNLYTDCSTLRKHDDFHVPGVTECALAMDELTVQVVADTRRLPLLLLQIIFKCKGAESILLVTDGNSHDSTTTMAQLVRNMVAAGVSLRVALRMATVNPARRVNMEQSKGRIGTGYDADILLLDDALNVRFVMARGKVLRNELDEIK